MEGLLSTLQVAHELCLLPPVPLQIGLSQDFDSISLFHWRDPIVPVGVHNHRNSTEMFWNYAEPTLIVE